MFFCFLNSLYIIQLLHRIETNVIRIYFIYFFYYITSKHYQKQTELSGCLANALLHGKQNAGGPRFKSHQLKQTLNDNIVNDKLFHK